MSRYNTKPRNRTEYLAKHIGSIACIAASPRDMAQALHINVSVVEGHIRRIRAGDLGQDLFPARSSGLKIKATWKVGDVFEVRGAEEDVEALEARFYGISSGYLQA